jgi:hypothetical protein
MMGEKERWKEFQKRKKEKNREFHIFNV